MQDGGASCRMATESQERGISVGLWIGLGWLMEDDMVRKGCLMSCEVIESR